MRCTHKPASCTSTPAAYTVATCSFCRLQIQFLKTPRQPLPVNNESLPLLLPRILRRAVALPRRQDPKTYRNKYQKSTNSAQVLNIQIQPNIPTKKNRVGAHEKQTSDPKPPPKVWTGGRCFFAVCGGVACARRNKAHRPSPSSNIIGFPLI